MVFDTAGTYVEVVGGDGAGYEWPQREHGINIDNKGSSGSPQQLPPPNGIANLKPVADDQIPEVHAGREVRHADRPQQSEKGNATRSTSTARPTCR